MATAFNLTAQLNLKGPSNVNKIVADIKKQLTGISATVNLKLDPNVAKNVKGLDSALKSLNSSLNATSGSANNAAAAIAQFGKAVQSVGMKNIPSQINATVSSMNKLNKSSSNIGQSLNQSTTEMQEFGKQAGLAIRRFAAFSAVTGVIYSLSNSISQGVQAYIEYDKELVRLQQVTGETAGGLAQLQRSISQLATSFGVSSKELTTVSVTLAQAGLNARDTERALRALALSSLAPSFDDMNETVEGSIALMKQFGIGAGQLEQALGSVNSVAAAFAVEADDLITAIQRTGGVFATASKGVSEGTDALNEFIAVFTSVRATTRESAETIATGLRTIFTRIQRGGTIDALKEFGVNLQDTEGKFVGAYKAVQLLSEGLSKLDPRDIKFSKIVEELGGFRQIGKVIPLIQQFAVAQDALKVAQQGQGSLAKDAATAQGSLANQIQKVREEFFALFREIGQSKGFQALIGGVLTLTRGLIKLADVAKGLLPALSVMLAFKGASALTQFASGFNKGFRPGGNKKDEEKPRFAEGGVVKYFAKGGSVPGVGSRDSVPAMLTPGEFVMRKTAVKSIGRSNLSRMNNYADGGAIRAGISDIKIDSVEDGDTFSAEVTPKTDPFIARFRMGSYDAYETGNKRSRITAAKLGEIKKYNTRSGALDEIDDFQDPIAIPSFTRVKKGTTAQEAAEEGKQKLASTLDQTPKKTLVGKINQTLSVEGGFGRYIADLGNVLPSDLTTGRTWKTDTKNLGGMIQKLAVGGVVQRKVGYIDYDVIANEANKDVVEKGMEETGQKGPRLYTDYLTDLAVKARKKSSIQKLRAVYGVAGSGKTTLARGQGTDNATLRKTERFPILSPEDIQRATEVLVLSSSVSKDKLDNLFSETDRTYTLSSTTKSEKEKIQSQRISRDTTGVGLEGRTPGTTLGVANDTAVGEALLSDKLGDRSVVLGRTDSGKIRRKSGNELVEVVKKKIGFTWGGFAPMTAGHESIMDSAAAMGISPEDFIYLVGANEGIKSGDASSYRTAIFDQDARVLLAKAGAGAKGATVLPKPRDFEVPQGFDISPESGRRKVLLPGKGSTAFVADKGPEETKKYKDAGYGVKNLERTGGISGTLVRDLIAQGDLAKLQSVLSPNVYDLISNNIGRIQNRANVLPSIIEEVNKTQGVKLEEVDKKILALGITRVDSKKVASDPEYAAKVEVLKELRAKRDKIKSAGSFEPYKLLAALATKEPDKYGLDLASPSITDIKPVRTVKKGRTQKANLGGLIKRFAEGGYAVDFDYPDAVSFDDSILNKGLANIASETTRQFTPRGGRKEISIGDVKEGMGNNFNATKGNIYEMAVRAAGKGLKSSEKANFDYASWSPGSVKGFDTIPEGTPTDAKISTDAASKDSFAKKIANYQKDEIGDKGKGKIARKRYGAAIFEPNVTDRPAALQISQIEVDKYKKKATGGIIQRFMAGGVAEDAEPMTEALAATKSRAEILELLKSRPNGLQDTAKEVGVNVGEITKILGVRQPDAKTKAFQEAIRREYVKTYNRKAGAARATTTKLEDKGFVFGAAGLFGTAGAPENIDIVSDKLSKSAKVRVVSGVMDKTKADQIDQLFTQGSEDLAEKAAGIVTGGKASTGTTIPNPNAEASIQGGLIEKMVQKLGGPGKVKGQGFDFPDGLKDAAQYFNLPPDIPTDVKRTLSGPATIKDNIVTYLKNVQGYNTGGLVQRFLDGGWVERMKDQPKSKLKEDLDSLKRAMLFAESSLAEDPNSVVQAHIPSYNTTDNEFSIGQGDLELVDGKELIERYKEMSDFLSGAYGKGLEASGAYNQDEMLDAIKYYQGGSGPLVKAMVNKDFIFTDRNESYETEDLVDRLKSAAQYTAPKQLFTGLGRSQFNEILNDTKINSEELATHTDSAISSLIGKTIDFPTFLSTSFEKGPAEAFIGDPGALMTIDSSNSKQLGIDVLEAKKTKPLDSPTSKRLPGLEKISSMKLAKYDEEKEFILQPNTQFKISKATGVIAKNLKNKLIGTDKQQPKPKEGKKSLQKSETGEEFIVEEPTYDENFWDNLEEEDQKTKLDLKAQMLAKGGFAKQVSATDDIYNVGGATHILNPKEKAQKIREAKILKAQIKETESTIVSLKTHDVKPGLIGSMMGKGVTNQYQQDIFENEEVLARLQKELNNITGPYGSQLGKFAGGGPVNLYHGSNTGTNDSVLESFKKEGAKSGIAQGYGQGAGFYVYSGKEKAKQQAQMRVGKGLGSFAVVQGDTAGKPMVLTFNESLDPATWDLDYELNKGSVVKWLAENYDKIKDKVAPKLTADERLTGIKDVVRSDRSKGIMSDGIRVQSDTGSRKTLYADTDSNIREGELIGQIMNRLQAQDPKMVGDFENTFFNSPSLASGEWNDLALKYVGSSPLKPTNIETFATGGLISRFANGGTVPALLTPGEAVIPPQMAKKIGYGKLSRMNKADRNGMGRYASGGGVGIVPGSGNTDSFGPVPLPVGSFVIRKKATEALGFNKGGAVIKRFAAGGGASGGFDWQKLVMDWLKSDMVAKIKPKMASRPAEINEDTVKASNDTIKSLDKLVESLNKLGISAAQSADILNKGGDVSYAAIEKALSKDIERLKISNTSIDAIVAAETTLAETRKKNAANVDKQKNLEGLGSVRGKPGQKILGGALKIGELQSGSGAGQQAIDTQAKMIASSKIEKLESSGKTVSSKKRKEIYDSAYIESASKITGIKKNEFQKANISGSDIQAYIAESMKDRKTLSQMDKQLIALRMEEYKNAGTVRGIAVNSAKEAERLAKEEVSARREIINDLASQKGEKGVGAAGMFDFRNSPILQTLKKQFGTPEKAFGNISKISGIVAGSSGLIANQLYDTSTDKGKTQAAGTGAALQSAGTILSTGMSVAAQSASIPVVGPYIAGIAAVGTAALAAADYFYDFTGSQKDAIKAAEKELRAKEIGDATDALNDAFKKFESDMGNIDLQAALNQALSNAVTVQAKDTTANISQAEEDYSKNNRGWVGYLMGEKPIMDAKEKSAVYRSEAAKYGQFANQGYAQIGNEIDRGASLDQIKNDTKLAGARRSIVMSDSDNVRLYDAEVKSQQKDKGRDLNDDERQAIIDKIAVMKIEDDAKIKAALKTKELSDAMDTADRAGRRLAASFQNITDTITQAINRIDSESKTRQAQMNGMVEARRGNAKFDENAVDNKNIGVLTNPKAYKNDPARFESAIKAGTSGLSPELAQKLSGGARLEATLPDVMTTAINDGLKNNADRDLGVVAEDVRKKGTEAINASGLSDDDKKIAIAKLDAKINQEQDKADKNNTDRKAKVDAFGEAIGELGPDIAKIFGNAGKALDDIISKRQNIYNTFAKNLEMASDAARKARDYFNKAKDIRYNAGMDLREAQTGVKESFGEAKTKFDSDIQALTGGVTDPQAIGQNIDALTQQREQQMKNRDAVMSDPNLSEKDKENLGTQFAKDIQATNDALNNNREALDKMANSAELAQKALDEVKNVKGLQQDRENFVNQLLTNTPDEADKLNQSFIRLQRNLSGGLNSAANQRDAQNTFNDTLRRTGSVREATKAGNTVLADQRKQTLSLMQDPGFRGMMTLNMKNQGMSDGQIDQSFKQQEGMLMQQMAVESGMINNPMVQQALAAKQDPNADPAMKRAADQFLQSTGLQAKATEEQGRLELANVQSLLVQSTDDLRTSIDDLTQTINNAGTSGDGEEGKIPGFGGDRVAMGGAVRGAAPIGRRTGGLIPSNKIKPEYASLGKLIDFRPQGTDTVPAMLSPGEFVINARSTAQHLPLLKAINSGNDTAVANTMSKGGVVYLASGGGYKLPADTAIDQDAAFLQQNIDATNKQYLEGGGQEQAVRDLLDTQKAYDSARRDEFLYSSTAASPAQAATDYAAVYHGDKWAGMTDDQKKAETAKYTPEATAAFETKKTWRYGTDPNNPGVGALPQDEIDKKLAEKTKTRADLDAKFKNQSRTFEDKKAAGMSYRTPEQQLELDKLTVRRRLEEDRQIARVEKVLSPTDINVRKAAGDNEDGIASQEEVETYIQQRKDKAARAVADAEKEMSGTTAIDRRTAGTLVGSGGSAVETSGTAYKVGGAANGKELVDQRFKYATAPGMKMGKTIIDKDNNRWVMDSNGQWRDDNGNIARNPLSMSKGIKSVSKYTSTPTNVDQMTFGSDAGARTTRSGLSRDRREFEESSGGGGSSQSRSSGGLYGSVMGTLGGLFNRPSGTQNAPSGMELLMGKGRALSARTNQPRMGSGNTFGYGNDYSMQSGSNNSPVYYRPPKNAGEIGMYHEGTARGMTIDEIKWERQQGYLGRFRPEVRAGMEKNMGNSLVQPSDRILEALLAMKANRANQDKRVPEDNKSQPESGELNDIFSMISKLMSYIKKLFSSLDIGGNIVSKIMKGMSFFNKGGMVYASGGSFVSAAAKGPDTVPAMLTPGEFVMNAEATSKHLPLLKAINSGSDISSAQTKSKGGIVYLSGGSNSPLDVFKNVNKSVNAAGDAVESYENIGSEGVSVNSARELGSAALDTVDYGLGAVGKSIPGWSPISYGMEATSKLSQAVLDENATLPERALMVADAGKSGLQATKDLAAARAVTAASAASTAGKVVSPASSLASTAGKIAGPLGAGVTVVQGVKDAMYEDTGNAKDVSLPERVLYGATTGSAGTALDNKGWSSYLADQAVNYRDNQQAPVQSYASASSMTNPITAIGYGSGSKTDVQEQVEQQMSGARGAAALSFMGAPGAAAGYGIGTGAYTAKVAGQTIRQIGQNIEDSKKIAANESALKEKRFQKMNDEVTGQSGTQLSPMFTPKKGRTYSKGGLIYLSRGTKEPIEETASVPMEVAQVVSTEQAVSAPPVSADGPPVNPSDQANPQTNNAPQTIGDTVSPDDRNPLRTMSRNLAARNREFSAAGLDPSYTSVEAATAAVTNKPSVTRASTVQQPAADGQSTAHQRMLTNVVGPAMKGYEDYDSVVVSEAAKFPYMSNAIQQAGKNPAAPAMGLFQSGVYARTGQHIGMGETIDALTADPNTGFEKASQLWNAANNRAARAGAPTAMQLGQTNKVGPAMRSGSPEEMPPMAPEIKAAHERSQGWNMGAVESFLDSVESGRNRRFRVEGDGLTNARGYKPRGFIAPGSVPNTWEGLSIGRKEHPEAYRDPGMLTGRQRSAQEVAQLAQAKKVDPAMKSGGPDEARPAQPSAAQQAQRAAVTSQAQAATKRKSPEKPGWDSSFAQQTQQVGTAASADLIKQYGKPTTQTPSQKTTGSTQPPVKSAAAVQAQNASDSAKTETQVRQTKPSATQTTQSTVPSATSTGPRPSSAATQAADQAAKSAATAAGMAQTSGLGVDLGGGTGVPGTAGINPKASGAAMPLDFAGVAATAAGMAQTSGLGVGSGGGTGVPGTPGINPNAGGAALPPGTAEAFRGVPNIGGQDPLLGARAAAGAQSIDIDNVRASATAAGLPTETKTAVQNTPVATSAPGTVKTVMQQEQESLNEMTKARIGGAGMNAEAIQSDPKESKAYVYGMSKYGVPMTAAEVAYEKQHGALQKLSPVDRAKRETQLAKAGKLLQPASPLQQQAVKVLDMKAETKKMSQNAGAKKQTRENVERSLEASQQEADEIDKTVAKRGGKPTQEESARLSDLRMQTDAEHAVHVATDGEAQTHKSNLNDLDFLENDMRSTQTPTSKRIKDTVENSEQLQKEFGADADQTSPEYRQRRTSLLRSERDREQQAAATRLRKAGVAFDDKTLQLQQYDDAIEDLDLEFERKGGDRTAYETARSNIESARTAKQSRLESSASAQQQAQVVAQTAAPAVPTSATYTLAGSGSTSPDAGGLLRGTAVSQTQRPSAVQMAQVQAQEAQATGGAKQASTGKPSAPPEPSAAQRAQVQAQTSQAGKSNTPKPVTPAAAADVPAAPWERKSLTEEQRAKYRAVDDKRYASLMKAQEKEGRELTEYDKEFVDGYLARQQQRRDAVVAKTAGQKEAFGATLTEFQQGSAANQQALDAAKTKSAEYQGSKRFEADTAEFVSMEKDRQKAQFEELVAYNLENSGGKLDLRAVGKHFAEKNDPDFSKRSPEEQKSLVDSYERQARDFTSRSTTGGSYSKESPSVLTGAELTKDFKDTRRSEKQIDEDFAALKTNKEQEIANREFGGLPGVDTRPTDSTRSYVMAQAEEYRRRADELSAIKGVDSSKKIAEYRSEADRLSGEAKKLSGFSSESTKSDLEETRTVVQSDDKTVKDSVGAARLAQSQQEEQQLAAQAKEGRVQAVQARRNAERIEQENKNNRLNGFLSDIEKDGTWDPVAFRIEHDSVLRANPDKQWKKEELRQAIEARLTDSTPGYARQQWKDKAPSTHYTQSKEYKDQQAADQTKKQQDVEKNGSYAPGLAGSIDKGLDQAAVGVADMTTWPLRAMASVSSTMLDMSLPEDYSQQQAAIARDLRKDKKAADEMVPGAQARLDAQKKVDERRALEGTNTDMFGGRKSGKAAEDRMADMDPAERERYLDLRKRAGSRQGLRSSEYSELDYFQRSMDIPWQERIGIRQGDEYRGEIKGEAAKQAAGRKQIQEGMSDLRQVGKPELTTEYAIDQLGKATSLVPTDMPLFTSDKEIERLRKQDPETLTAGQRAIVETANASGRLGEMGKGAGSVVKGTVDVAGGALLEGGAVAVGRTGLMSPEATQGLIQSARDTREKGFAKVGAGSAGIGKFVIDPLAAEYFGANSPEATFYAQREVSQSAVYNAVANKQADQAEALASGLGESYRRAEQVSTAAYTAATEMALTGGDIEIPKVRVPVPFGPKLPPVRPRLPSTLNAPLPDITPPVGPGTRSPFNRNLDQTITNGPGGTKTTFPPKQLPSAGATPTTTVTAATPTRGTTIQGTVGGRKPPSTPYDVAATRANESSFVIDTNTSTSLQTPGVPKTPPKGPITVDPASSAVQAAESRVTSGVQASNFAGVASEVRPPEVIAGQVRMFGPETNMDVLDQANVLANYQPYPALPSRSTPTTPSARAVNPRPAEVIPPPARGYDPEVWNYQMSPEARQQALTRQAMNPAEQAAAAVADRAKLAAEQASLTSIKSPEPVTPASVGEPLTTPVTPRQTSSVQASTRRATATPGKPPVTTQAAPVTATPTQKVLNATGNSPKTAAQVTAEVKASTAPETISGQYGTADNPTILPDGGVAWRGPGRPSEEVIAAARRSATEGAQSGSVAVVTKPKPAAPAQTAPVKPASPVVAPKPGGTAPPPPPSPASMAQTQAEELAARHRQMEGTEHSWPSKPNPAGGTAPSPPPPPAEAVSKSPRPQSPAAGPETPTLRPSPIKMGEGATPELVDQIKATGEELKTRLSRYTSSEDAAKRLRESNVFDIDEVTVDPQMRRGGVPSKAGGRFYAKGDGRRVMQLPKTDSPKNMVEHELGHALQSNTGRFSKDGVLTGSADLRKELGPDISGFLDDPQGYTAVRDLVKGKMAMYTPQKIAEEPLELLTSLIQASSHPEFDSNPQAVEILKKLMKFHGYAKGGVVYANNGALIAARPQGTDTVPAMLTPGEFVINRDAAQEHMPVLEAINSGNYSRGGIVQYLAEGGIVQPHYLKYGGQPDKKRKQNEVREGESVFQYDESGKLQVLNLRDILPPGTEPNAIPSAPQAAQQAPAPVPAATQAAGVSNGGGVDINGMSSLIGTFQKTVNDLVTAIPSMSDVAGGLNTAVGSFVSGGSQVSDVMNNIVQGFKEVNIPNFIQVGGTLDSRHTFNGHEAANHVMNTLGPAFREDANQQIGKFAGAINRGIGNVAEGALGPDTGQIMGQIGGSNYGAGQA